jgi:RNA polymerase sigma-70 factor (ECF subfamily)
MSLAFWLTAEDRGELAMSETSASLLDRLRVAPDGDDWTRLVDLYTPLIRAWLARQGLPRQEADDLTQEVLTVLVRRLPDFERQPRPGAFRRWLRTITVNCLRDHWRASKVRPRATGDSDFRETLEQLEDPDSGLSRQWEQEHDQHVARQLLEQIRPRFEPTTWEAFRRFALLGEPADQVASALGLTPNAVFIAKSRVLARLREEGAGLLD